MPPVERKNSANQRVFSRSAFSQYSSGLLERPRLCLTITGAPNGLLVHSDQRNYLDLGTCLGQKKKDQPL